MFVEPSDTLVEFSAIVWELGRRAWFLKEFKEILKDQEDFVSCERGCEWDVMGGNLIVLETRMGFVMGM